MDGITDPYRFDCEECEEECEEGSEFCKECPYNFEVLFKRLQEKHEDFPNSDEILPLINRVFDVRRDIEILGNPLNNPTPEELMGLRILYSETKKLEQSKIGGIEREQERVRGKIKS